jgi:sugar/nucleoside kinase (ribokinase family)
MRKTIIGSGIYNLDEIVVRDYPAWPLLRPFADRTVLEEVGGTCGNVMCILAWMDWDSRPQAGFDDTPQGLKLTADLARYGCDLRHVSNSPAGGTTLLRCVHKKDEEGRPLIACRAGSPGGSRFPRRRFLRVRDEAPAFLESLDGVPDVYFFDDPAAGHRAVARALREKGALVWFEPSRVEGNPGLGAVAVSDVVKFSGENIPDASFADAFTDKLFIQTLGAEGLRFRLRGGAWRHVPPVECRNAVDWEGAGDWTTAAFINALGEEGRLSVASLDEGTVARLLARAQRAASRSVGFLSSKGLIAALHGPEELFES